MTTKTFRKPKRVRETAQAYTLSPAVAQETYQASITPKGQLVIPAPLRRKYGITPKTRIVIYEDGERIVLKPVTHEAIERLRGSLAGGLNLTQALLDERAKDREREDAKFRRLG
jgi:AbrB family looped-hinge helix DNA binding protein